jgi:uncharacterized protein (DUF342 family)
MVLNALIALGRQPENGRDAEIQLYFDKPSTKPAVEEGGKAHFRELKSYVNVRKNQILAKITPATSGTHGFTVTGAPIPNIAGRSIEITAGDGVRIVGNEFFADCDGFVLYKGGVLSVSDTIEIVGNVDFSTGNINFTGLVHIHGDVLNGFTVKARDIVIDGVCFDATIIAENNITVTTGVKSRGKYFINAGGDIALGYCENARITAKKNITIKKYAFNCILNAGEGITAEDRSTITGGEVNLFSKGILYNVGTQANTNIFLRLGKRYNTDEILSRLKAEKDRLTASLDRINAVLAPIDITNEAVAKNLKIEKLLELKKLIEKRIELFNRRMDTVNAESICANPELIVKNEMKAGVAVYFYNIEYIVRTPLKKIRLYYNQETTSIEYTNL